MRGVQLLIILSLIWAQASADPALSSVADGPSEMGSVELLNRYRGRIQLTLKQIQHLQPDCPTCGLYDSGDPTEMTPACRDTYKNLFKIKDSVQREHPADQAIDVRVAFGYMDNGRGTEDRYAAYAFGAEMRRPCVPGRFACGFAQNPDDADVFTKELSIMGPDGVMRRRKINLRLRYSSASDSDLANRHENRAEQEQITNATRDFYVDGLKHADMLFYVGHARDGGGPDFSPPVLKASNQHPNYPWYHQHHPGLNMIEGALPPGAKSPKLLGIFACYAEHHFSEWLTTVAPKSGLILSGQQDIEAAVGQATASLDSALGLRCESQFNEAVDVMTNVNHTVITPVRVQNLFHN